MFDFLSRKFSHVLSWVKDKGRLTEDNIAEALTQVREALLEADVPFDVIEQFLAEVKEEVVGQKLHAKLNPGNSFIKIVHEKVLNFLGGKDDLQSKITFQVPSIIMVLGLQGSGKTTTIGKLAYRLKKEAESKRKTRRILLASVDMHRPAAREQLKVLADQVGVDFFLAQSDDPVTATREIVDAYKQGRYQYLLFDTAGRLHVDESLMAELGSVERALKPNYKILVLDTMTGQESLAVARRFDEVIGFNGAIMSKIDSDARGGAAFSFKYILKKPLYFVGTGEKVTDLDYFVAERMASRILGMGDIMTLIEKADEHVDRETQEDMSKRLMKGNFSLQDFAEQMSFVGKMGTLQNIARYLPGMQQVSPEMLEKGESEMKQFRAIISSMTPKERLIPQILDSSRKKRVALGSGVTVEAVNQLLQKFEQSKQFVKMFKKMGKFQNFFK